MKDRIPSSRSMTVLGRTAPRHRATASCRGSTRNFQFDSAIWLPTRPLVRVALPVSRFLVSIVYAGGARLHRTLATHERTVK